MGEKNWKHSLYKTAEMEILPLSVSLLIFTGQDYLLTYYDYPETE